MKNPNRHAKLIIFTILLVSLASTYFVYTASADTMTVRVEATPSQPQVGETLTVNIKIPNAQNLFGVDVTLDWNSGVLQFISATPLLGVESHSEGVLHESTDYPIVIQDNANTDGQYHLLANAQGSTTASFSGSGTIVTLKFNVTSAGSTGLSLDVELAQKGNTEVVVPATSVDSVNITVPSSSPTPTTPEFPFTTFIVVLVVVATATVVASAKLLRHKNIHLTATKL
jgi:hypothetical protein